MVSAEREGYRYLEIFRPVVGLPSDFLGKVALIGEEVFGSEPNGSIERMEMMLDESPEGMQEVKPFMVVRPITKPKLDVYSTGELKLLLTRAAIPESQRSNKYNFNYQAASITERKPRPQRPRYDRPKTIADRLDSLVDKYDIQRNDSYEFTGVHVSVDTVIGQEFVLYPRSGRQTTQLLAEQSEQGMGVLPPKISMPSRPFVPMMPFAKVPKDIRPQQHERFVEMLQEHLPLKVRLGGVETHAGSVRGKGC